MNAPSGAKRSVEARLQDIDGMIAVMRRAVRDAILRSKRAGHSVAIWRDGRVVWLDPKDIPEFGSDDDRPRGASTVNDKPPAPTPPPWNDHAQPPPPSPTPNS